MGKLKIILDQDGPLASGVTEKILDMYNEDFNDSLKPHNITYWGLHDFVKPECGVKIYRYFDRPGFFRDLKITEGAQEGVQKLIDAGHEIYVVSASPKNAYTDKYEWLREHFPMIHPDNICFVRNKSMIRADVMVDDAIHNLEKFDGFRILFDDNHNRSTFAFYRAVDWNDVLYQIGRIAADADSRITLGMVKAVSVQQSDKKLRAERERENAN